MAQDNATTVREAIERLDQHLLAGVIHHTGILNAILQAQSGRPEQGSTPHSAKPKATGAPSGLDSIKDVTSNITRFLPGADAIGNIVRPIVDVVMKLLSAGARTVGTAASGAGVAAAGAAGAASAGGAEVATGAAAAAAGGGVVAALASNPVGWAVALAAAAVAATVAILAMPSAVASFTDSLLESNRALAEVSGSMAAVMAKSDFRNILRDIQRGERLAPSANALADALGDLKDSTLDLEVTFMKIVNSLGVTMAGFAETIAGAIKMIPLTPVFNPAKGLGDIAQGIGNMDKGIDSLIDVAKGIDGKMPDKEGMMPMADWLENVARDRNQIQQRNDPRFKQRFAKAEWEEGAGGAF